MESTRFSEELVAALTNYFSEECGETIGPEEAMAYLTSLGQLYGSFSNLLTGRNELRNTADLVE
jgi:hypothetical protein